jgi:hypothetical protein
MTDSIAAKMLFHRRNIERYGRLLATELTDLERQYLHKRIAEEQAQLESLAARDSKCCRVLFHVLYCDGAVGERPVLRCGTGTSLKRWHELPSTRARRSRLTSPRRCSNRTSPV